MFSVSCIRGLLLAAVVVTVAGCGGAGQGSPTTPGTPQGVPGPLADAQFVAVATSAHSASLAWTPSSQGRYAIERQLAGGNFVQVATVSADAGMYLDDGLDAHSVYAYRLVAADGTDPAHPLGEGTVTTSEEEAVVTDVGAPSGDPQSMTVPDTGGRVVSADARYALEVPPGALPSGAVVRLQPISNTAPDGREDGIAIGLPAMPARALTLTVGYGSDLDAQADGLRVAIQRSDRSWLSLPLKQIDKTARTLSAELPPALVPSVAATQSAARAKAQQQASSGAVSVSVEFHVVKYLAFHLVPKEQTLEVGGGQLFLPHARVRGWEVSIAQCVDLGDGVSGCLPVPVLEDREVAFLNEKGGFTRKWLVFLEEGGSPGVGTIAPQGAVGAMYSAPSKVPQTNPVIVSFVSTNDATGRTLVLSAAVTIVEDRWSGTMSAQDGPSSAGTTLFATAQVDWHRDSALGSETYAHYQAEGRLDMTATDDDCTINISPPTQALATDPLLQSLDIDHSTTPATYHARLITFWNATITGICPGASSSQPALAGWGWDVQGTVSADGRTIEGQSIVDGHRLSWSFSR